MKSFSIFAVASLFSAAIASPMEVARQELNNFVVPFVGVQGFPGKISVDVSTGIIFTETPGNETVSTRDVEKRALTHIDVYYGMLLNIELEFIADPKIQTSILEDAMKAFRPIPKFVVRTPCLI